MWTRARSPSRRGRGQIENSLRGVGAYIPLYKAALHGKWEEARNIFVNDPEARNARITAASETALHIAVGTGKAIDFVFCLVQDMLPEDLALTDQNGETALSVAATVGNMQAAKLLVNKNPYLPYISGNYGFPIHNAAQFCHKEMVRYLMEVTTADFEPNPFAGENGGRLLIDLITADFYDIALDLIKLYPEIATTEVLGLGSGLSVLAKKSAAFSSGTIPIPFLGIHTFHRVIPTKKVTERKLMQQHALELLKGLCEEILELDDSEVFSLLVQALHNAAKLGIPEIIEEIVVAYPPAIWFTDEDDYNVFQLAMLHRREKVFNLIYQMTDFQVLITRYIDPNDNNMLHLVGKLPPSNRLSLVSGPAILIQREMQWFEQVSKIIHPSQKIAKNKDGKTPRMVFREEHEELMKKGAKWMKQTASSSAVFATLIATVAFAGGMHVPGGNSAEGLPLLIHQKAFVTFAIADSISLSLSVISILLFLSIITSRYSEDDYISDLPMRLMLGVGTLICSISIMCVAFGAALLLFHHNSINNLVLMVYYVLLLVFLVIAMLILYRMVSSINGWGMFGKKGVRILH